MAFADFSQFVVTTVYETARETYPVKVRSLSPHVPAAFTRTSSNFWTSVPFATLSVFPSLICGSCPSGQRFAYSFFQIPSHGGHPCCSAMCFVVAYAHSGLTPVRERPCWANKNGFRAMPFHRLFAVYDCFNKNPVFDRTPFSAWLIAAYSPCPTAQSRFCFRLTFPCLLFPGICLFLIFTKYLQTAKNPQTLMFTGFSQLPE